MAKSSYLVLIRHAESEANVAKDNSDVPTTKITKLGHAQAKRAAEYISSLKFLNIKYIVSSPYTRTLETAEYIAKKLKLKVNIEPDLREASGGITDGVKYEDIKHLTKKIRHKTPSGKIVEKVYPVGAKLNEIDNTLSKMAKAGVSRAEPAWIALIDEFIELSGGETDVDVYKRASRAIKKYTAKGNTLVVSHGGTIKEYLGQRFNINASTIGANYAQDANGKDITNCHISIIHGDKLMTMLDTKYLGKS